MLYGINVKWDCKPNGKYEANVISFKMILHLLL